MTRGDRELGGELERSRRAESRPVDPSRRKVVSISRGLALNGATVGLLALILPVCASAAAAKAGGHAVATYITKEEVEAVNRAAGVDRTIKVVDIGHEHFAVGVIHRGPVAPSPGANALAPRQASAADVSCGVSSSVPADAVDGLSHDKQTEGYYILSGGGILVTGGQVLDGRAAALDSEVVTTLNGPSCRGKVGGAGVVRRAVKAGDIVIIPAGVPHGWAQIEDHVDYLSFRPSMDALPAGYEHPSIKK